MSHAGKGNMTLNSLTQLTGYYPVKIQWSSRPYLWQTVAPDWMLPTCHVLPYVTWPAQELLHKAAYWGTTTTWGKHLFTVFSLHGGGGVFVFFHTKWKNLYLHIFNKIIFQLKTSMGQQYVVKWEFSLEVKTDTFSPFSC